ncbi:MAG: DNA alkylation repair protein [Verrucomicrobiaceae bacterium]|nr:DNA alkylation repair protein [Verrucomicrobiaceae bacterium]
MTLSQLRKELRSQATPAHAEVSQRFFKTGPGEYGEGDLFMGLKVPQIRAMLPRTDEMDEGGVLELLRSKWHEERLLALLILVRRFQRAKKEPEIQRQIVTLYLANTEWVNNWDLVDSSAPHLLGAWLLERDRAVLGRLAGSDNLWEQRIAVLATQAFIRSNDFRDTLRLCADFLNHEHDLMHKACGWMLREVGKRDVKALKAFLEQYAVRMPRTMLRYAIEKLPREVRLDYMSRRA